MLRVMPTSMESRSELPRTTTTTPSATIPPTTSVRTRLATRLRMAISSRIRPCRDAGGGGAHLRLGSLGRLAPDHAPVLEPDDGAGVGHHLGVVGGEDEGGPVAPVHLAHQVDDVPAGLRVEVGGGLVGEHERRVGDQRPGHGHALPLAAGELAGAVAGVVGEPHRLEERVHPPSPLRGGHAPLQEQRELHVLEDGEHRHQVEGLEDEADVVEPQPGERALGELRGVLAVHPDGARSWARRRRR